MADTFRNRLIEAMRIRGIKATDLAEKARLSKAQISQYVNGVYEAKQYALWKLAVALDVSEAWLMGYDVEMQRPRELRLTNDEKKLILAYREQPELQAAIKRFLGIE